MLKRDEDVNRYLAVGIVTQFLFFLVVIAGLYARLSFPDLTVGGDALPMDGIVSAYVVQEFTVAIALIIVLGLLSAGISTLESLIQSLSTSITNDIIQPLAGTKYLRTKFWAARQTCVQPDRYCCDGRRGRGVVVAADCKSKVERGNICPEWGLRLFLSSFCSHSAGHLF
ncbi:MAG: hypothetical protein U5J63_05910 [Fodinibius sp.]|nr:hypothetical protein [Fodinibius sp.]